MLENELLDLGLCDIADLIARKQVTSLEVTTASIHAAQKAGVETNSIAALETEQALHRAAQLDAFLARKGVRSSLHGVPIANKDMFYRRGFVTGCGSKIREDFIPDYTATVVERLEDAGAVTIGRLRMAEFAMSPTGHNRHYGAGRNPWDLDRCTGGSSSGSGAAVASRVIFGSIGSDTGGSIRMPAAMCGVTGIKPTQGRVSRYGAMPLAFSVDCVGPIARTAKDCARLLTWIAGEDERDTTASRETVPDYERALNGEVKGLRIGYAPNLFGFETADVLEAAVEEALSVLVARGAVACSVDLPHLPAIAAYAGVVQRAEMATIHAEWMRASRQDYGTNVSARLYAGYGIPATAYIEALSRRGALVSALCNEVFDKVDVLICPTLTMPVPTIQETDVDTGSRDAADNFGHVSENCRLVNYLGLPAISLPCGFDSSGMPIGLQMIGLPFDEAMLLKVADAYQRETDWHRKRPKAIAS
ncbi:Asp-tRNA(Asn)/Glu-tRNA(Gln) amidotransferase subunit GatA [Agrobacterium rubi]|uniref:Indoleacetamide hydrolase n=1 Tax=Agrobacterium rubi TaxID=28099 RepID=A0AAE7UTJ0_9HYPH|nr:Asp-tRNA(Asn)/Glu-tRNA(Gln) amidotransferase subunit GatA [Agrobacterium rubi]NTF05310.1 Asp-tRNA(Asn)/Glu-tRNA(Gln) amidotransferase subunit GatA [Agrobacterium rubi]NTF39754.1 Asp-tRNA(Asn)/Glu-tRNA(Gln) amidotransferase subunit GatA [Agrobacterium rubi]QTG03491.1 Asp-tRNA(Asn)/Glu-tRNA(Gln) amidotransferase subunit GatA [Agrobacterium rubi]